MPIIITVSASTAKAIVTRRRNPIVRSPGSKSSRRVPRCGKVSSSPIRYLAIAQNGRHGDAKRLEGKREELGLSDHGTGQPEDFQRKMMGVATGNFDGCWLPNFIPFGVGYPQEKRGAWGQRARSIFIAIRRQAAPR